MSKTPKNKSCDDDPERLARTIFVGNLPLSITRKVIKCKRNQETWKPLYFFVHTWKKMTYHVECRFHIPGVPKNTGHCLISCNVKAIKAIAMK
jgi:hypothetical protein